VNIRKSTGEVEEFDSGKIKRSVINAGSDEGTAETVVEQVPEKEGLSTSAIREIVEYELRTKDPESAERYFNTRRLKVKMNDSNSPGVADLSDRTIQMLRLEPGETIILRFGDKTHNIRCAVRRDHRIQRNEIGLHGKDMDRLGIDEGERLLVKKNG
jgi:hypothetical protein